MTTLSRTSPGSPAGSRPGKQPAPPASQGASTALPIGGLARAAGVSTRTVRYYEEIGLLRTARRFAGGRRVFDAEALERLRFIGRLKRLGFSLEEISELNAVFELQRSTAAMLQVLDGKLGLHVQSLADQLHELERLREDLLSYRRHIGRRLAAHGTDGPAPDPEQPAQSEGAP